MRWIIFLLMIVLSCGVYADQYGNMEYYGKAGQVKCYSNGQAVMPFTQFKGDVPLPGLIKDIAIRIDEDNYRRISGKFYDTNYQEAVASGIGETVYFISDEYVFNERTNYTVVFSGIMADLIPVYEYVALLKFQFTCPGYEHSCRYLNFVIDNCTIDTNWLDIYFSGLGLGNFSQVNVTRDVDFTLNRQISKYDIAMMDVPLTGKYFKTGLDSVMLRIPVEDLKGPVDSVSARVTGCFEPIYKVINSMDCTVIKPKNYTFLGQGRTNYECKPQQAKEENGQICTQVLALPPERTEVAKEPNKSILILQFLERVVKFTISMAYVR